MAAAANGGKDDSPAVFRNHLKEWCVAFGSDYEDRQHEISLGIQAVVEYARRESLGPEGKRVAWATVDRLFAHRAANGTFPPGSEIGQALLDAFKPYVLTSNPGIRQHLIQSFGLFVLEPSLADGEALRVQTVLNIHRSDDANSCGGNATSNAVGPTAGSAARAISTWGPNNHEDTIDCYEDDAEGDDQEGEKEGDGEEANFQSASAWSQLPPYSPAAPTFGLPPPLPPASFAPSGTFPVAPIPAHRNLATRTNQIAGTNEPKAMGKRRKAEAEFIARAPAHLAKYANGLMEFTAQDPGAMNTWAEFEEANLFVNSMKRIQPCKTTNAATDSTFPQSDAEANVLVCKLRDAYIDFSVVKPDDTMTVQDVYNELGRAAHFDMGNTHLKRMCWFTLRWAMESQQGDINCPDRSGRPNTDWEPFSSLAERLAAVEQVYREDKTWGHSFAAKPGAIKKLTNAPTKEHTNKTANRYINARRGEYLKQAPKGTYSKKRNHEDVMM